MGRQVKGVPPWAVAVVSLALLATLQSTLTEEQRSNLGVKPSLSHALNVAQKHAGRQFLCMCSGSRDCTHAAPSEAVAKETLQAALSGTAQPTWVGCQTAPTVSGLNRFKCWTCAERWSKEKKPAAAASAQASA